MHCSKEQKKPASLNNIESRFKFTGSKDEEAFRMLHVAFEVAAAPALAALPEALVGTVCCTWSYVFDSRMSARNAEAHACTAAQDDQACFDPVIKPCKEE